MQTDDGAEVALLEREVKELRERLTVPQRNLLDRIDGSWLAAPEKHRTPRAKHLSQMLKLIQRTGYSLVR